MNRTLTLAALLVSVFVVWAWFYRSNHRAATPAPAGALAVAQPAKPKLPAPRLKQSAVQAEPDPITRQTNFITRLIHGEEPSKLRVEQLEGYLAANHRDASSLLAAFHTTGDKALLEEAKTKFPNDPAVAYVAWRDSQDSPQERRHWLNQFEQAAPDNALAYYLSASDYFKSGQTDLAIQEIEKAYGKTQLQDYGLQSVQSAEEAYLAAGYSEAEAKAVAASSLLLPQLAEVKGLSRSLVDVASSYTQADDPESAQAALRMGLNLGERLDTGASTLIQDLVGVAIQSMVLKSMDPNTTYDSSGQTVAARLDQLAQQRSAIKALTQQFDTIMTTLPDTEVANYFDRMKLFGESQALQWLVDKYGQKSP